MTNQVADPTAGTGLVCPTCGEPIGATDAFCENCGATLGSAPAAVAPESGPGDSDSARTHLITPPGSEDEPGDPVATPTQRPCAACGGPVGDDGYCTVCGVKASNGREHTVDQPAPTVAGVCDKGIVHPRNEDAMALAATDGWSALVVCDGVTTATDSDVAAQAAAIAARDLLARAPRPVDPSPAARITHWSDLLQAAAIAADDAAEVAAHTVGETTNPPSCTFVAAVADGELIVTACVGDSRAYWLPDSGPAEQLSTDDSWAQEQIASGVDRVTAENGPKAHAITRWLGIDSPDVHASIATTTVTTPGWLLVCSDGLWNYSSAAADLAALVAAQPEKDPLPLAEALVAWANAQGGHDNITVALARLGPGDAPTA